MKKPLALRALVLLSAALLLAACGTAPPKPTVVVAALQVTNTLNPDSRGRASPLVLRLFELKSAAAFNSADFFTLWDHESQALGADAVAREEFLLRPGEKRNFERTLQPDTRHLGVVAAFRDLEHARWRDSLEVVPHEKQAISIRVESRSVSISGE